MKLLAAIVNYRSSTFLADCLSSLEAAGVDRVVIVDNFSSDLEQREVLAAAELAGLRVDVELSEENLGFGAGVNRAVEALKADDHDLIWVVNPDAVVTLEAAVSLRQIFESDRADIVSPLILTGSRTSPVIWFAGGEFVPEIGRTQHLHLGGNPGDLSGLRSVSFVTGAAPMMRADVFRALGGFREDLFLYWEDADLSHRATRAGLRLAVDLDAPVWHAVGGSGGDHGKSAVYYRYMQRNRMIVAAEWTSRWNLLLGRGALETLRLSARPLRERSGKLQKFRSGLAGLLAGFEVAGRRR